MNRIRIGLVGLVVLALTGVTAGGASAATGRGTAAASITLLDVSLGNVQNIKVLTDEGQGTLDPTRLGIAAPRAFGQLSAVTASGALNLSLPNPPARAEAPGVTTGSLDAIPFNLPQDVLSLAGASGLPALPTGDLGVGVLASGVVDPIKVEAFVDAAGARSAVGTEVPNLDVLQGLISVKDVRVGSMSANASPTQSQGDTGVVTVGEVNVLDLSAFLGALGLGLGDLNLPIVSGLVQQLGLTVPTGALGLGDLSGANAAGVLDTVAGLANVRSLIAGAVDCSALSSVTGVVDSLGLTQLLGAGGLLDTLPIDSVLGLGGLLSTGCTTASFAQEQLDALGVLDPVLNTFQPLLDNVFSVLDGAPLLQLSGIEFSALAKATETLAGSSATTSAKFGTLKVGALPIGALDLNATVEQVTSLVNTLEGTLNGVTGVLGLANLIDIGIMERTSSVKAEGAYNVADAGLNVLRVSINPPAVLGSALSPVLSAAPSVSGLLGSVTGLTNFLPVEVPLASNGLAGAFGLSSLLTQPTTIRVGAIRAQSDFTTAAPGVNAAPGTPGAPVAPPVSGELPRTGNNGAWLAALAALSLAGAFGITRSLRKRPADIDG